MTSKSNALSTAGNVSVCFLFFHFIFVLNDPHTHLWIIYWSIKKDRARLSRISKLWWASALLGVLGNGRMIDIGVFAAALRWMN